MENLINEFKYLIDFRDNAITSKFGENSYEAFNYPENRFWYADHITPIDNDILAKANQILQNVDKNFLPLNNIADVFRNQTLKTIYLGEQKAEGNEQEK